MDKTAFGGYGDVATDFLDSRPYHSPWVLDWFYKEVGIRGSRVLDVGCGVGNITRILAAKQFKSVSGVDPDKRMIDVARKVVGHHSIVNYYVAPMNKLLYSTGEFDAAIAHWSFDHFCMHEESVVELKRVLKRGAVFMTVTWSLGPLGEKRNEVLRRFVKGPIPDHDGYESGAGSYARLLERYGFVDVSSRGERSVLRYTVAEAYAYMRRSGLISHIPEERRRDAYRALHELCLDEEDKGYVHDEIWVIADRARTV